MTQPPLFIGSEIYRRSTYGAWHPLRIPRVSTVMDLARALNWLPAAQYQVSPRARPAALEAWHEADYLQALQAAEDTGEVTAEAREVYGLGTPSNPVFPEMFRRPATAAGGSILAGALLKTPGIVYNPAGGTHHGLPGRANGFCYLNDPVLGILSLRASGFRRIAYVDIDAHYPDGVAHGFSDDPDILMISVHEEKRWPFSGELEDRGAGEVWNLPVPRGFNDTEMAAVLDRLILPRLAAFGPEAVVLQCGADAVEEDPLSRLSLSNNAHWAVVSAIMRAADRLLVLGGGGYNPWTVGRLWTGVWAVLNQIEIPERLSPEAEAVLRGLEWRGSARGKSPPEHWFTSLRDSRREGPVRDAVRERLEQLEARARVWA
jgi:acetoin utilization protein AcuC